MAKIDYKDKYEKAVQAAMLAKQDTESAVTIGILEEIFPELRESEDERIRKLLVEAVTQVLQDQYCSNRGVSKEKVIAWLEEQGEKVKPIEGFDTEFERQVSYLIASAMNRDYEYTKDFVKWTSEGLLNYAKREFEKNSMGISEATKQKLEDNLNKALEKETPESWNKFLDEQDEQNLTNEVGNYDHKEVLQTIINKQKPIWSKKDICLLNNCISLIEDIDCTKKEQNFLKSLKNRYTWKPSEEQLHYLYWIANIKLGDSVVEQEVSKHLNELYEQLKQL